MIRTLILLALPLPLALLAGCNSNSGSGGEKTYALKGTVKEIDATKKTVKIDHEEIPGHMGKMTMTFDVIDVKLLDGLAAGDAVEGKLKTGGGKDTLTELKKAGTSQAAKKDEKSDASAEEEAEIKENLAKLSPEDRKLADEQKFCPTGERLGSMGVPPKVMVKGQPVFLCCKRCAKEAEAKPDETLAKIAELKKKK